MAKGKILVPNALPKGARPSKGFVYVDKQGNIRAMTPNRAGRPKGAKGKCHAK